jgi:hypothetical protein
MPRFCRVGAGFKPARLTDHSILDDYSPRPYKYISEIVENTGSVFGKSPRCKKFDNETNLRYIEKIFLMIKGVGT